MKRILMTGSTGFLGSHLKVALEVAGHRVIALARTSRVSAFVNEVDVVIHLAAQTEVGRAQRDPIETFDGNIRGTWEVLEAARKVNRKLRVIVASSDKAYGEGDGTRYRECDALRGGAPYETSKACADLIAQSYLEAFGMDIAITRCGNLYGPGRINWTTIIPGTIKSILQGERPIIRSDGRPVRDYVYIDDAVQGYLRLVHGYERGIFNFGSGTGTSVIELVKKICVMMKWEGGVEVQNIAKSELLYQVLDPRHTLNTLLWNTMVDLDLGLSKCIDWYTDYFRRSA